MDPINVADLPEPIVHHIMSFLTTKDVTRLSVLSKKFFSLWSSYPVIEFDQKRFAQTYHGTSKMDAFIAHVLNSVMLREINTVLSEFRVNANFEGVSVDSRFDAAILRVLENGVKCMELNLGFSDYVLPNNFASQMINVLRLKGLQLDLSNLIKLCPSLTTVCLKSCVIIKGAKFSSKTLIEIELHSCSVKCIKIDAPNLRSFIFSSVKDNNPMPCHIDVLKCRNIRYFSLNNVVNGRDWIEEHVFSLSELRTVILNGCHDIGHIRFWNDKLERVEFRGCNLLTSIELKATSLESFTYKGNESAPGGMSCKITFLASKCIKYLSIKGASLVTDRWLEVQLAKMTRLEKLKLEACNSLRKIKLIHEKLQILELRSCLGLLEAEIHTPQLISFVYQYGNENIGQQSDKMVTDQWLEALLAKMSRLERLKLKCCNSLKKIKVLHAKLQILELYSCNGLEEADIDTPQLVSFMYHGNVIELGKMVTRTNCIATLSMKQWTTYDNATFCKWRNLLSFFGHFKALKLICNSPKEMMMPELHREKLVSPLYGLQHLEIQIKSLPKIDRDLVDGLLWLSPLPNTLHLSYGSRPPQQMIIKFVYSHIIEGEEDRYPFCCTTKPVKCWKHHIKRLEIQSSDVSLKNKSNELQKYFLTNARISDLIVTV